MRKFVKMRNTTEWIYGMPNLPRNGIGRNLTAKRTQVKLLLPNIYPNFVIIFRGICTLVLFSIFFQRLLSQQQAAIYNLCREGLSKHTYIHIPRLRKTTCRSHKLLSHVGFEATKFQYEVPAWTLVFPTILYLPGTRRPQTGCTYNESVRLQQSACQPWSS